MKEKITDAEVDAMGVCIKHESNLLYIYAQMMDLLIRDINRRLKLKLHQFDKEQLRRLKDHIRMGDSYLAHFENFLEPVILKTRSANKYRDYEASRHLANELVRLTMAYYATCANSGEAHSKVFDLLNELPVTINSFSAEDINRFIINGKL